MKAKRIPILAAATSATFLTGCSVKIADMTPETVPTNPSGIYTLSAKAELDNDAVDKSSVDAYVVIDGEKRRMAQSNLGYEYFDYDYDIPEGREGARYYYILNYRLDRFGGDSSEEKEVKSGLHSFELTDRYSISLDAERAPIGSRVTVLGKGFSRGDRVYVGGTEAETRYVSTNAVSFVVPSLEPGNSYPVEVRGGGEAEAAGSLRVDPGSPVRALPASLELAPGEQQALAFALSEPAPEGGLYLDVTTDVPDSVIMPEVVVPAGARTVSVTVEGGDPGEGNLYVNAPGVPELTVPVTVR